MSEFVCGGTSEITGARFSIYPMTDRFVEVILSALQEVDTSKVWVETDDVTTCVRGRQVHVFDVVKAIFVEAAKHGGHVVLNATFSNGCPGDTAGDATLAENETKLNEQRYADVDLNVAVHYAIYPLGIPHYMDVIMKQVDQAKKAGVLTGGVHYASRLDGNVLNVFHTLEQSFEGALSDEATHVVMTVVMSANSPSQKAVR